MFAKYHYLSHSHNNAATVYYAEINSIIVGFISVIHFPHPIVKNMVKIHRLVVKPDYQGLGIGSRLLDLIANRYIIEKKRVSITTSSPSLIRSLAKHKDWSCVRKGRVAKNSKSSAMKNSSSSNRITVSFEYTGIINENKRTD